MYIHRPMKTSIVLIFLFVLDTGANGQTEKSLLIGYNQGYYGFAEIGLELNKEGASGIHNIDVSYIVSNEIKFGNKTTIGPKIGFWVAAGPAAGLNLIYYTNFNQTSLVLRPEIGFGVTKLKLVYGYNLKLTDGLTNINQSQVNFTICLNFAKGIFR